MQKGLGRLRELLHHRNLNAEYQFHALRSREPLRCEFLCGQKHRCPGQFTETLVSECQTGNRPRHSGGLVTDRNPCACREGLDPGRRRNGFLIVEGLHSAIFHPDDHVATTTQISGFRVDHGQREADRHSRVHGVPALTQDTESNRSSQFVRGRHPGVRGALRLGDLGAHGSVQINTALGALLRKQRQRQGQGQKERDASVHKL